MDYSNPSSWSPISLTSHLGEVVEQQGRGSLWLSPCTFKEIQI